MEIYPSRAEMVVVAAGNAAMCAALAARERGIRPIVLKVDTLARVENGSGLAIPGLFAAGELVSGLFFFNYPGGTGLAAGSVFGCQAGYSATEFLRTDRSGPPAAAV